MNRPHLSHEWFQSFGLDRCLPGSRGLVPASQVGKAKAEAPHEDAPEAKKTEEAPADEGDKAATTPPEAKGRYT